MEISDVSSIISSPIDILQQGLIGVLIMFHLPIYFLWAFFTFYFVMVFVLNHITIILPWDYKHKITKIIPYSNNTADILIDYGAYCKENGLIKFKLKTEQSTIDKPNQSDIYPNHELIIITLSKTKMTYGRRIIDYNTKTLCIEATDISIADVSHFDRLLSNIPDYIKSSIEKNLVLLMLYCATTFFLVVSNAFVILPMIWKMIFGCNI